MKKLLLTLLVILGLVLLSIYVFIPSKIEFSEVTIIKTQMSVASRFLMNESEWSKWFPGYSLEKSSPILKKPFLYKKAYFDFKKATFNAAEISISDDKSALNSIIHMISINEDSIAVEWKSEMPQTYGPLNRLKNYLKARRLQKNLGDILNSLKAFLGHKERVYGVYFHEIISKDSTLIAMQCVTTGYPSTQKIYSLVNSLKKYIISQNAKENNFPMLSVRKRNDSTYETMVAIPVNKYLNGNDSIFNKRFVPWKVLTADVHGGVYSVTEAMRQMNIYMADYHKVAMALPFQILSTDRSAESDTSKWVTGIYTPIP
ncbi:MAG TPA: hypothetical protein VN726_12875 [Hanamia sp.]|nr:hypothetical protein [Hanamia sp.]